MEDIDELRRSVRKIMKDNGREWESPEKYSGELSVSMKFENRPDLDCDIIETVTARSIREVSQQLKSLQEKWETVYQDHIQDFLEESNGGSEYSIKFNKKKQSIRNSSSMTFRETPVVQPEAVTPRDPYSNLMPPRQAITPRAPAIPQNSKDEQTTLYRLCEGNHRLSKSVSTRFSRIFAILCHWIASFNSHMSSSVIWTLINVSKFCFWELNGSKSEDLSLPVCTGHWERKLIFFFQTSRQSRKMFENVLTLTSSAVAQAKNVGGTVALVNPRTEIGALLKFQSKLHRSIPLIFWTASYSFARFFTASFRTNATSALKLTQKSIISTA